MSGAEDALTPNERAEIVADAYNRRVTALHDAIRAWAAARGVTVSPTGDGQFSVHLTRGSRIATVRQFPSWEQKGPGDVTLIVEDEDSALRLIAYSGDSGMISAAAMKGLLSGLLFPEEFR